MPPIDIDREAAREAAENELTKPIYPRGSLTDQFNQWIDELIFRIVAKGDLLPGGWFTLAVLAIIAVIAVIVAVRIARRTLHTRRGGDPQLFGAVELSAAQHRELAQQSATRGDWAAAIRHRLRAVARHLEETGVLTSVPGRTATELARDAGAALPELTDELSSAATAFNDVTYGELPGTEAAYRMISDLDQHLGRRSLHAAIATPTAPSGGWEHVR
ncbi:DUF4129 domain-containing protein [Mycolicibacterium tokaiense]|uniref:Conserved membrane protein of uncharacterized function n=1 Tax=Mycolicibacterium tokaiense TaxID=39695 RepID=A0A378TF27_9MYCO|nr:DUF4129 domain-containing protein [Mycolicibacterium tokaiense]BBY86259.1 membrane protein [Mycolicibacterium tokaiense]STZ59230.1 Conserved membrane protein of uncharacterised function [Mycolicibacterium tokaiense]